jgi:hypothetical protein
MSGYQPFLISEFKTGLFDYQQPWIRPQDAFEPLTNAYIYRGVLEKRLGYTVLAYPAYRDSITGIVVGDGGPTYSGITAEIPIRAGSLTIMSMTAANIILTAQDNGAGIFVGDVAAPGTIDYVTGAFTVTFNANIPAAMPIMTAYTYLPATATPSKTNPIMGLKIWVKESTDEQWLVGTDTRRAFYMTESGTVFDPISSVKQVLWKRFNADLTAAAHVFQSGFTNIAAYTCTVSDTADTLEFDSTGACITVLPAGIFTAASFVPATGAFSITTGGVNANDITATFELQGDYFTGDNTNFFNATNWQSKQWMVNNKDRITSFDGTYLERPPFLVKAADYGDLYQNAVSTCLDIDVYKNRFLVQKPIMALYADPNADNQTIRWSKQNIPNNLVADLPGNGGFLAAPTSDVIRSSEFLRDQLIVLFGKSHWLFRFTNDPNNPFRFDKINNTKSVDAPYGTVAYDERVTSAGVTGLLACDGVNVQRYDLNIVDITTENPVIDPLYFAQSYGIRFDALNQAWMLYRDVKTAQAAPVNRSTNALVFNFLENTWSIYDMPMSVLGLYYVTLDKTWNDFAVGLPLATDWIHANFKWTNYLLQKQAPCLLGGGHNGAVYILNAGVKDFISDGVSTAIEADITTTRWNPFLNVGQKVQFGYIDIYYATNSTTELQLSFYTNNTSTSVLDRNILLTSDQSVGSTPGDDNAMQRVYLNLVGEFLRMEIYSNSISDFTINGFVLWAKPAGRLTP